MIDTFSPRVTLFWSPIFKKPTWLWTVKVIKKKTIFIYLILLLRKTFHFQMYLKHQLYKNVKCICASLLTPLPCYVVFEWPQMSTRKFYEPLFQRIAVKRDFKKAPSLVWVIKGKVSKSNFLLKKATQNLFQQKISFSSNQQQKMQQFLLLKIDTKQFVIEKLEKFQS